MKLADKIINSMLKTIESTKGVKCDCCGWADLSVTIDEFDSWVDKPCPKCGTPIMNVKMNDLFNEMRAVVADDSQDVRYKQSRIRSLRAEYDAEAAALSTKAR